MLHNGGDGTMERVGLKDGSKVSHRAPGLPLPGLVSLLEVLHHRAPIDPEEETSCSGLSSCFFHWLRFALALFLSFGKLFLHRSFSKFCEINKIYTISVQFSSSVSIAERILENRLRFSFKWHSNSSTKKGRLLKNWKTIPWKRRQIASSLANCRRS